MEQHLSAHGAYLILVHLSCPKELLASPLSRIYSSKTSKDILRLRVWRPRPWFPRWGAPCSVGPVAPAHIFVILVLHTKNSKKNIAQRQVKFFHWRLLNFNVGKFDVPMWKWEGGVKRILRLGRLLGGGKSQSIRWAWSPGLGGTPWYHSYLIINYLPSSPSSL